MKGQLSFKHEKGMLHLDNDALVVGIDETGCEDYKDRNHPVFGLGGCAIRAGDYFKHLDTPWRELKEWFFDGEDKPLHASDLKNPEPKQLEALERFFTNLPIFRFATMSASTFKNETRETNIHLLCISVMNQVAEFAKWIQPTEIVFVCDNSNRIEKDLLKHFTSCRFGNGEYEIKPQVLLASKDRLASCVEIADFVVHPAGAQVRNRVLGRLRAGTGYRKDFNVIFNKVDRRLSSYQEILQATETRT